ncbi:MAG TPA: PhzF family phenazine biosynthesis protein [Chitinophagaceae bacterium]
MKFTIYQVDAFTKKLFQGNPAAIVPLEKWLDDNMMQLIAMENNLAETAFFVPSSQEDFDFDIRWFTPAIEINLCGHATLGSAWVIFNKLDHKKEQINFSCKSGKLSVDRRGDVIQMDFPSWKPERFNDYPDELLKALKINDVVGVYKHRDILIELQNEEEVKKCSPDFSLLKETGYKVIITAPGTNGIDFVSRFFAPSAGIDEDPVTGSSHSQLIPFWAEKLNKKKMFAKQISQRGGELECKWWGDRVTMAGQCVFYMQGEITIDNKQ